MQSPLPGELMSLVAAERPSIGRSSKEFSGHTYLAMKAKNSRGTVCFNGDKSKNIIFLVIGTAERQAVPQIADQLVRCGEFEPSLHRLFVDINALLELILK